MTEVGKGWNGVVEPGTRQGEETEHRTDVPPRPIKLYVRDREGRVLPFRHSKEREPCLEPYTSYRKPYWSSHYYYGHSYIGHEWYPSETRFPKYS